MPHIRLIFPEKDNRAVIEIIVKHRSDFRHALSIQFPEYSMDSISIIPEPISEMAMSMADNLLPLEFVIDIGKQEDPIDDEHSRNLVKKLIELCPKLADISFGLWIREMPSNGFTENKLVL